MIDESSDLLRVFEAKLRERREFLRHFGTDDERRLLAGSLGGPRTVGMLEHINRAVKEEAGAAPAAAPAQPSASDGLPLPGS